MERTITLLSLFRRTFLQMILCGTLLFAAFFFLHASVCRFRAEQPGQPDISWTGGYDIPAFLCFLAVLFLLIGIILYVLFRKLQNEVQILLRQSSNYLRDGLQSEPQVSIAEMNDLNRRIEAIHGNIRSYARKCSAQKEELMFQVSALSHDIKSLLTVIQGNAELLDETAEDLSQRALLKDLLTAADRMKQYFRNLILYSRTMCVSHSSMTAYPLQQFLSEICEDAKLIVPGDAALRIVKQVRKDCTVKLHLQEASRALINLLQNAAEYSEPGHTVIHMQIVQQSDLLVFRIRNNGAPFSKELLQNYGKLFYHQDPARNAQKNHFGIGLAYARHVAEMHRGTLKLYNSDGLPCVRFSIRILGSC